VTRALPLDKIRSRLHAVSGCFGGGGGTVAVAPPPFKPSELTAAGIAEHTPCECR